MKRSRVQLSSLLAGLLAMTSAAAQEIVRLEQFDNHNHPQIGYWFITPHIVEGDQYLTDLDDMIDNSLIDFYFLDARMGSDFREVESMHELVGNVVRRAHERGVKIGIRLKKMPLSPLDDEDREGFLGDCAFRLDRKGSGSCRITTRFIRHWKEVEEKRVFRVFAFRKTGNGFYDPDTLVEVTDYSTRSRKSGIEVAIEASPSLAGLEAFVMAEFLLPAPNNFSPRAVQEAMNFIEAYKDIPLDGVMLDEYKNWPVITPWEMMFRPGSYRNRYYSKHFAEELEQRTGEPPDQTMLHMRFAPRGRPEVRMKAINDYMDLWRDGPMRVERAVFERWQEIYGEDFFMSAHNTLHNKLDDDDIWATGLTWWTIPRDYGQTDEWISLPVQMGVAMAYDKNAMYNMYYDRKFKLRRFQEKAFSDLCYGIRTHYHAFNDRRWRVQLEEPEVYEQLNLVENSARLLNRFNPSLPDISLLVIFGVEALQNWYPDASARGRYDISDNLGIEEKAVKLWDQGYLNALVPSDLVNNGSLTLNEDNRPVLNGRVFDAVVYLYPQYSKQPVMDFLERYTAGGGKLMLVGDASHDFQARDATQWFARVAKLATVTGFNIDEIGRLGVDRNRREDRCINRDGSRVLTDLDSLRSGRETRFELDIEGVSWSGSYIGFAAIAAGADGALDRFAAMGGQTLSRNGESLLELERATDLLVENGPDGIRLKILDPVNDNRVLLNRIAAGSPAPDDGGQ